AILNNHAGVDFFKHRGFRNVRVIENCFPDVRFPRERPAGGIVRVVTVARFVRQKDYPVAIEAFMLALRKVPCLHYRIIGHGEEEAAIRKYVECKGVADRVEIMVNPPDVGRLVDECDIYLSTSRWEGTSNSIMEAMDASLPVVATDAGDNKRLVENDKNGFIRAVGDVGGIAACLVELARSPELRNEMGICGNQILRERYGKAAFAAKYFALLGCD
ncbi:MAG: glycosyltransferase family 4 protein, partial [Muribaculaceae bacterium]|nr:glycosyltransferase family 4 protein [Muribaculaceae bacterium]